jgi:hypothetical protein
MKKSTEEYEALFKDQKQFADEVREMQDRFKQDFHVVQEKALATVGTLDNKFHAFMDNSMSELIRALADNQSNEIVRIRQEMQGFSRDLMAESSQFAKFFNVQLQAYHEQALTSIQVSHEAQIHSYNVLSDRMGEIHDSVGKANLAVNSSFSTIVSIEQRLGSLSHQADHIAQGFAFFSALPKLLSMLVRGCIGTVGVLFLFSFLCKVNKKLGTYAAGACSSAYLFHLCGVYQWLGCLCTQAANIQDRTWGSIVANLSSTQKAAGLIMLLWLAAYPVGCINVYLGSVIGAAISRFLKSYWLCQYNNDGGTGILPSIEIPTVIPSGKSDFCSNNSFGETYPPAYTQSTPSYL